MIPKKGFSVRFRTTLHDVDIDSFNSGMRGQLQERVAVTLGVSARRVALSAFAGSVNVDVEVHTHKHIFTHARV